MPHSTTIQLHGLRAVLDDQQQQLTINGRKVHLGAQEYVVARNLLVHCAAFQIRQTNHPLVSLGALAQGAGVPVHRVKHLISDVRGLLLPHDLDIKSVRGEGYYLSPLEETS